MTIESQNGRGHAVVIGGSMAALLAARVLAEDFQSVTLIERDRLPTAVETRRGVPPQGRHTHGLLAGGRETLEKLFSGISGKLTAAGAVSSDIVGESRWFNGRRLPLPVSKRLNWPPHDPAVP
jgi:flavin-dependent dehydrogenase